MWLRGAASSLLLFHLFHVSRTGLPRVRRWTLVTLLLSLLAYLVCSHPDYGQLSAWIRLPAMSLCLISAPLLWLTAQIVFEDTLHHRFRDIAAVVIALTLGWLAHVGAGGEPTSYAYKIVLIAFIAATLYDVLKHWRSDLVPERRHLRLWVVGGLCMYALLVVIVEFSYLGDRAPTWLATLHLAGIAIVAGVIALVVARHPMERWLGVTSAEPVGRPSTATPHIVETSSLTPQPPELDRKALLKARLLTAMGEARAYAQEGLTLAQLAAQLDTSPAQLRETINQNLRYRNFNDFLHHYRVDEAAQRLQRQDLPILSIALDVGYASIGPFNRAFKQIKGVTPSEFRAQNRCAQAR